MPPRTIGVPRLGGTFKLCLRPSPKPATPAALLPRTQTASLTRLEKKRMSKQDPYKWQQIQARTAAHQEIKSRIAAQRKELAGHPVRGITTPFVESFDSAGQAALSTPARDLDGSFMEVPHELPTSDHVMNYQLSLDEVNQAINEAGLLTRPVKGSLGKPANEEAERKAMREAEERHAKEHATAAEAIRRIVHMDKGGGKDKRHANIRRIIETFGRHNTDQTVKQKALALGIEKEEVPVRAGPDTGSSEVQIAILTAKMRALANELEKGRGYRDKVGKRDLRLMAHRRQRLLRYMERKERGSGRWHHMIETLGLSPATWKEQITF